MADRKKNVAVPDDLWDRLRGLSVDHRRSLAGETRVAIEHYVLMCELGYDTEEVFRASGHAVSATR